MRRTLAGIAIFGIAALTALLAADTAREQTLQRGIELMESKGDLAKAMPLFEEASKSPDRAVAARALLYLGEAQERQGADKARATYERIVKEFGSQAETAAAAQKRLAALGGSRFSGTIVKRPLCSECGDAEADLTSDGRLMAFTDWDNNDLAIRDMATGSVRRMFLKPAGVKDDASPETPVFSPDRKQIAYNWDLANKDNDVELRIVQAEPGRKPRTLLDKRQGAWFTLESWLPDGKSLLVSIEAKDHSVQLARVSVSDGAVTPLKSFGWRRFSAAWSHVWLSPDGKFVVYSARAANPAKFPPVATDPADQHIYLLAADGSSENEIVKTSGVNKNPLWTPDGQHILFTSDRTGHTDLWSVAVKDGKAVGPETMVYQEIGDVSAMGIRSGSYIYSARQQGADYINIVDLADRKRAPTATFVGIRAKWSPDGKSIAFKRRHPGSSNEYDLVWHRFDTGEESVYSDLGTTGQGAPFWLHDGRSLMTGFRTSDGQRGPSRINLVSREVKRLSGPGYPVASSDDSKFYGVRAASTKEPPQAVVVDAATGQERSIVTVPAEGTNNGLAIALSPDERTLALSWMDRIGEAARLHIGTVSVDGTNFREIFTKEVNGPPVVAWSNDGRTIFFHQRQADKGSAIMRVPADGSSAPALVFADPDLNFFDLSPDGSQIAYGVSKRTQELWTLDNVLSALK